MAEQPKAQLAQRKRGCGCGAKRAANRPIARRRAVPAQQPRADSNNGNVQNSPIANDRKEETQMEEITPASKHRKREVAKEEITPASKRRKEAMPAAEIKPAAEHKEKEAVKEEITPARNLNAPVRRMPGRRTL
ncbi:MAG: hypothetical protein ACE3JP_12365 [Ectobacillus sp.]